MKTISYRLKFIDKARFMAGSLSNLVSNFAEGIDNIKCKYGHNNKNIKTSGIKILSVVLNTPTLKII